MRRWYVLALCLLLVAAVAAPMAAAETPPPPGADWEEPATAPTNGDEIATGVPDPEGRRIGGKGLQDRNFVVVQSASPNGYCMRGLRADVRFTDPVLRANPYYWVYYPFTNAHIMLTNNANLPSSTAWVEVAMYKSYPQGMVKVQVEWVGFNGDYWDQNYFAWPTFGEPANLRIQWNTSLARWEVYVDSTMVDSLPGATLGFSTCGWGTQVAFESFPISGSGGPSEVIGDYQPNRGMIYHVKYRAPETDGAWWNLYTINTGSFKITNTTEFGGVRGWKAARGWYIQGWTKN
jgi:hypothetical protein